MQLTSNFSIFDSFLQIAISNTSKAIQHLVDNSTSSEFPSDRVYYSLVVASNALDNAALEVTHYKQKFKKVVSNG